jgi:hypothetical protein
MPTGEINSNGAFQTFQIEDAASLETELDDRIVFERGRRQAHRPNEIRERAVEPVQNPSS